MVSPARAGKNFLFRWRSLTVKRPEVGLVSDNVREWPYLLTLAVTGAVLFFYRLGAPGLMDPDEGRYAEIAREMLLLKDWVVPHLNFLPYLEKPPLVYWFTALSFQVFGLTEAAARLPAAVSALAGVFLVYYLGRALWNSRAGFLGALILSTASGYAILGRLIILDMPFTFVFSLGVAWGYLAYVQDRRHLLAWAYAALALALLVKGPVALVLAALIWGLWTLLDRRHSLSFWLHPVGLAVLAVISLPWFIWVAVKYPEYTRFFLWEHHVERYVAGAFHQKPFYYYVPVLLGLMLPWSWLLPWSLARLRPAVSSPRLFLLIWAGVIFLFFSFSKGKLVPYILPAFLPLALLLGESLAGLENPEGVRKNKGFHVSVAIWALVATGLALLYAWPPAPLARLLAKGSGLEPYLSIYLVILALTPWVALVWKRPAVLLAGAVVLALLIPPGMASISSTRSPREMGLILKSHWQPEAALVGVELYSQGLSFYAGQPFYLLEFSTELDFGRRLRPQYHHFFSTPAEMAAFAASRPLVFFLVKKQNYQRLKEWLPGKFVPLARWKDCLLLAYTGK